MGKRAAIADTGETQKERPILMSTPMVRAILDRRKTQTRRIVKPKHQSGVIAGPAAEIGHVIEAWGGGQGFRASHLECLPCPYGSVGDRLYLRESYYQFGHWEAVTGKKRRTRTGRQRWKFITDSAEIRFDAPEVYRKGRHHKDPATKAWHKRLARFMPRWASRITLEITKVWVERLQDISEEDAKAEGVIVPERNPFSSGPGAWASEHPHKYHYSLLWDSINGKGAWDKNPWVWVISFKRDDVDRRDSSGVLNATPVSLTGFEGEEKIHGK